MKWLQSLVGWFGTGRARRRAVVEEVEPRILFSADLNPALWGDAMGAADVRMAVLPGAPAASGAAAQAASSAQEPQRRGREIVFIDAAVADAQTLIDALLAARGPQADVEVVQLRADTDGLQQIHDVLAGETSLDAVHIVSHGSSGQLRLGSDVVGLGRLQAAGDAGFSAWRNALTADADLLLWGCNVGEGDVGREFVERLAALTGADVAASVDLTGSAALGGDAMLEREVGAIESSFAMSRVFEGVWVGTLDLTPQGSETRVNTTTTGTQATTPFGGGNIAVDANGNYVIVWQSDQSGTNDIYAQRYSAAGVAQGAEFRVNTTTGNEQTEASVAMDSDGDFVVTWTSTLQDGSGGGVYGQRFNASGLAQGSEFRVNTATAGDQALSRVAMDGAGNFVVAFTDFNTTSGDVWVQRYTAGGAAIGGNVRVNSTTTNNQSYPDIAMRPTGEFLVAWESTNQDGSGLGVYAQRFDASGNIVGANFLVNVTTAGNQDSAQVGYADDGSFVIAWSGQDGSGYGMFARRYDASGVALTGEIQVNTYTASNQLYGDLAVRADGAFIVTWSSDAQDGSATGVYAQQFDAAGNRIGGEVRVNTTTTNSQQDPSIVYRGNQAVVVWQGNGVGDAAGVFHQRLATTDVSTLVVTTVSDVADGATTSIAALLNNRGADGQISLREAIIAANNTTNGLGGADRIQFNIAAALVGGVHTITSNGTALPTITGAVLLDGWSEPDYAGAPIIELNGNNAGAALDGLNLSAGASGSTIRGFIINRYTGNGIEITSANNVTVQGNWIGLNAAGTAASANAEAALNVIGGSGLQIGGTTAAARNVFSGNTQRGIYFNDVDTSVIEGNYVGTNAAGTADVNGTTASLVQGGIVLFNGASGNTVGGSSAASRNVISGNNHYGVEIQNAGSQNNTVAGNYIGTNASGTAAIGNSGGGMSFWGAGTGNLLANNVLSGNLLFGVLVGNGSTSARVQGNVIGLAADGNTVLANTLDGVYIDGAATGTLIGTDANGSNDASEGNVISGNNSGIVINGAGTTGTLVQGNRIGTDSTGLLDRGNTFDGVRINDGATGNTIGGSTTAHRNIISGNNQDGIQIDGENSDGNTIQGNFIGIGANGTTVLGNSVDGILITSGADNTVIGGTGAGQHNVIGGNALWGIEIWGATSGTVIRGNYVGTDETGTLDQGNTLDGIAIGNGATSNTVGGTGANEGNTVAFNRAGVSIWTTGTGNAILGNAVYSNDQIGIDLSATSMVNGVTANDAGDADAGGNNQQNFPVLATARTDGAGALILTGTLNSTANSYYRIEFFANTSQDSTGHGEGQTYLGFANVATDGSGNASINSLLSVNVPVGSFISATATRSNISYTTFTDTSEFARNIAAVSSTQAVIAVDTSSDTADGDTTSLSTLLANKGADGFISLREAITAANNTANGSSADRITFNISGTGVHTINVASALPTITGAVILDASTDDSFAANGNRPAIVLDGNAMAFNGLVLAAGSGGSTVRGLSLVDFSYGIEIQSGSDGNTIEGNYTGLLANGSSTSSNIYGVAVFSNNNTIGGTTAAARNVLSFNQAGVYIGGNNNVVVGNYIGTDATGQLDRGNAAGAVMIGAGSGNRIGGTTAAERNVLASSRTGIEIFNAGATGTTVQGNYIGVAADGTTALGNDSGGIWIGSNSSGHLIGGTAAGAGNLIANNSNVAPGYDDGVMVDSGSTNVAILGNRIVGNSNLGIDLGRDGVSANDAGDADTGANNLQNFPVLGSANSIGGNTTVIGRLNSGASTTYRIEFFSSPSGDASGSGEAAVYLGAATVTTNASGNVNFTTLLTGISVTAGHVISATATVDLGSGNFGSTSEFAQNVVATAIAPTQPALTVPGAQATNEDTALVFSTGNGNTISVSDQDGGSNATLQLSLAATNGTLALSTMTGLTVVSGSNGSAALVVNGTESALNTALQGLSFAPAANYSGAAQVSATLTPGAGLEGLYTFNDSTANDQSAGTANNGSLLNGASVVADGTRGPVLNLDGVDDRVQVVGQFGNPQQVTLAAWINLSAGDTGGSDVISLGDNVVIRVDAGNTLRGFYFDGSTWLNTDWAVSLAGTGWRHVAYTNDDAGNVQRLYLDGQLVASSAFTSAIAYTNGSNTVIGAHGDGSALFDFNGRIDDARIYSRALSAAEIAGLAANSVGQTSNVAVTVNSVNDAPTLGNGALAAVNEDTASPAGATVSSIFSGQFADVDAGSSFGGIAIVGNTANAGTQGAWQYSTNSGTHWHAIGTVADGATALAVSSSTLIRFVPVADYNGTPPALTVRGLDNTYAGGFSTAAASQTRVTVNTSSNGGSTAIAAATATLSTSITAVNDAPSGVSALLFSGIFEDDFTSAGKLVSDFTAATVDPDAGALKGIYVSQVNNSNGQWQYTLNGSNWFNIGTVSPANALLLPADATTRVRFVPDANWNGVVFPFEYGPWDQTSGTAGSTADTTVNGGSTAYGAIGAATSITVSAVNDAPVLADTALSLTVTEDAGAPVGAVGALVSAFTGGATDVDAAALKGIAITATVETNGTWHYSTDGGSSWQAVGAVSNTAALLLADNASTRLYFAPAANYSGSATAALTLRAWDQSTGAAGTKVSTASNGGTTAFSTATDTVDVTVTAVNDAPVITSNGGGTTAAVSVAENSTAVTTVTSSDVDGGAAVYSISGGADAALFTINSSTGALSFVSARNFEVPTDAGGNNVYDVTVQASDGAGGTDAQDIAVTVTNVNEAPVNTVPGAQTATEDTALAISGLSVADVDGNLATVQLSVGNGALTVSLAGGATVSGGANGSTALTLAGTGAQINAALATLSYQGNANFNGSDTLTVLSTDALGATDSDTVAITVTAVNDAPTFNIGDGIVTTAFGAGDDSGFSVTVQADGKVLVAGSSWTGTNYDFALVRYNSDGSLDASFSGDGKLTTAIGSGSDAGFSVTVQADGKILVAGNSYNGTNFDFALVRYNSDGTLDTSFSGDGMLTTAIGSSNDAANSVAVQADGKILVAGNSYNGSNFDFAVVRYNSDGTLDASFSGDGKLTTAIGASHDSGRSVTVQPDGKIVVAGYSRIGSNDDFALVRYNSDGTLDTSFSGDGMLTTAIGASTDSGFSVTVQADGKILVAGESWNGSDNDFALVRYNSDGTLDTSFSGDGLLTTDIAAGNEYGNSVTVQADGKILVAGYGENGGNWGFAVVRYNSDGTLDTSFSGDGKLTTTIGSGSAFGYSVTVQADGKILVAGESYNGSDIEFALVRYNSDGTLDTRFDSSFTSSLGGTVAFAEGGAAVVLDADVQVFDAELSAANNFNGATLTLVRNGGASAQDVYSATGTLSTIAAASGNVIVSGVTIGTYTNSGGTLAMTFNASATSALVDSAIQQVAYGNSSDAPPASVQINWTFNDGNSGAQGSGGALTASGFTTVTIAAVNDAPTLGNGTLAAVNEDAASPAGQAVSMIFVGQFSDPDAGSSFAGIAIVGNTANAGTQGAWQYSSNGGVDWFAVGGVSDGATALAVSSSTLIRFLPVADYHGTPPALTVRGLDDSHAGGFATTAGGETRVTVDTSSNGGTTAIAAATATLSTSITAVNDAPVITSNGGGANAAVNVAETTTAVATVTSSDVDGGAAVYSILAGGDGALFTINASTGVLSFIAAPDFEAPTDAGANNIYDLTVQVSDGAGGTGTQAMAVTVTDVSGTLVVTTSADNNDSGITTGATYTAEWLNVNRGADAAVSLREALIAANNTAGTQTVSFAIAGTGTHTINVTSALPQITDAVILDASTDDSFGPNGNRPAIVLDGNDIGAAGLVLTGTADGSTVRGFVIRNFGSDGIWIRAGSDGNTIAGNHIGRFNADGSDGGASLANGAGLYIQGANNTIGGVTAADRNVISGNTGNGVGIYQATATGNTVAGNFIGVGIDGSTAMGNANGVRVLDGAGGNTIGGATTASRNVISGNTTRGVQIGGVAPSHNNVVQGNYIGTDATGTLDLGNTDDGVFVLNDNSGNQVLDNLISGNDRNGITLGTSGTNTGTIVRGNLIGVNAAGTAAVANSGVGILVGSGSTSTTIGGTSASQRNVISGNSGDGIRLSNVTGAVVQGNYIGVGVDGTVLIGNGNDGIEVTGGSANTIGGVAAGAGNVISGNAQRGVLLVNASTTLIEGNRIGTDATGTLDRGNASHGIDIFDAPDNIVRGNLVSGNGQYGVQFWGEQSDRNLVVGNLIGTDAAGTAALGNALDGVYLGGGGDDNVIGGTTLADRNVLSGNGDDGIELGGAGTTGTVIRGNHIGTNAAGTASVANARFGVVLYDGVSGTQVGGAIAGAGNLISGNALRGVQIDGSANSAMGNNTVAGNTIGLAADGITALGNGGIGIMLYDGANGTTIGGSSALARNIISANAAQGIEVFDSSNVWIAGNIIGLDASGAVVRGNTLDGVALTNGSTNITIGTNLDGSNDALEGNVISGNGGSGVLLSGVSNNTIRGNLIGLDAGGTLDRGNASEGVSLYDSASNTIGGTTAAARNVISGNDGHGVLLVGTGTTGNVVRGNYIGTNAAGSAAIGNTFSGIGINNGANGNTIGGTTAGAANLLSGNGDNGIGIADAGTSGNVVEGNAIGVNAAQTAVIGNVNQGLWIGNGASGNTIGGTAAGAGNVIGGSTYAGVELNGSGTSANTVAGNFIGTDSSGSANLANGSGVVATAGASNNMIGGTAAGAGNLVAFNLWQGVAVTSSNSTGNAVLRNAIRNNGGPGIDLGWDGPTPNDANDADIGPNDLQNTPLLTSAVSTGGNTTIAGSVQSTANATFRIEFFSSPTGDASGHGEGEVFLGFVSVTTDGAGFAAFNQTLAGVAVTGGHAVTATATVDQGGTYRSTSEFAGNVTSQTPPVNAVPGAQSVAEDTPLAITGLSVNDPDGNLSTVRLTVANGNVSVSLAGGAAISAGANNSATFTLSGTQAQVNAALATLGYQGASHFNGADTLTVLSTDALGATDSDTVAITVTAVNDAPVLADASLSITVAEDAGLPSGAVGSLISAFTSGITDADGAVATGIAITGSDETNGTWHYSTNGGANWTALGAVSNPSALLLADNGSTRLYFAPVANHSGNSAAALTLRAWDQASGSAGTQVDASSNGGSTAFSSATDVIDVAVTAINDAPVITSGGGNTAMVSVAENTTAVTTVTSTDIDGGTAVYSIAPTGSGGAADASRFSIDSGTGAITFAAAPDFEAPTDANADNVYEVTVQVSDGAGGFDTQVISVTVTNANEAPVNTVPGAQTVNEDTALAMGGISVNDLDGNVGTVALSVGNGTLTVSLAGGATIGAGANGSGALTLAGTQAQINAALATLGYQGTANFNGSDTLTVLTTDSGGLSDSDAVAITVSAINDAPTLGNGVLASINEDTANPAGQTVATVFAGQLGDVDASASLAGLGIVGNTANAGTQGAWQYSTNGGTNWYAVGSVADGATALAVSGSTLIRFLPVADYHGTPPSLTVRGLDNSYAGGFSSTAGSETRTFIDTTSNGGSTAIAATTATLSTSVTAVNDAPVITSNGSGPTAAVSVAENSTAVTTVTSTDVDGGTAAYSIVAVGSGGAADAARFMIDASTGALIFATAPNFEAPTDANADNVYEVTVQTSDGVGGIDTQLISVSVTNVNETPVNTVPGAQTVNEDTLLAITGLSVADVDVNVSGVALSVANGTLSVNLAGGASIGAGANGSAALTLAGTQAQINAALATLSYQGTANFNGIDTLTVLSTDSGGLSDSDTVALTVSAVSDAPTLGNGVLAAVAEDTVNPAGQSVATVFAGQFGDVDAGASMFGIAIVGNTANAGTQGAWQYSSDGGANWFAVGAVGDGASALAVSSSTRVRFLPVADHHGAPPSLTVRGLDNSYAGAFSSTAGSETRTFIDTTSNGGSTAIAAATATLSTSVTAVNDAPVITSNGSGPTGAASVAENAAAGTWVASVTVSDPDLGDIVSFALVQDGAGRFTIDPATGRVLVAPGALLDFEAQATFDLRLRVTDAGGLSSEQSLRVNLLDVAEPTSPSLPSVPTPEPAFPPSSDAPAPGPAVAGAPSVPAEAEAAASPPAPAPTSTVERNPKSRAGLGDSDAGSAAGTGVDAESAPLAAPVANGDDRRDVGPGNVAGSNPRTNQQPPDATFGVPALTASWGWGVADAPVWSEAWSATSAGNSQDTTMRIGSAAHRASAIEVQGNDAARTSEDRTTPETLGEIVRDPVRVSSVAFSAGFIWWLTRSGGLLMTMLMGIPAWRHIDLLPVLARTIDEDDDEDDAHRTPAGTSPRALHSDAADSELDPSSAAAQAVDGLFDRDRDRDHHRAAPQAITPPP